MVQIRGIKTPSSNCGATGGGDRTHLVHHWDVSSMCPEAVVHGDESQALPEQEDLK